MCCAEEVAAFGRWLSDRLLTDKKNANLMSENLIWTAKFAAFSMWKGWKAGWMIIWLDLCGRRLKICNNHVKKNKKRKNLVASRQLSV